LESQETFLSGYIWDPSSADLESGVTWSWSVTKNGSPYGSGSDGGFDFSPDDNGTYVVTLTVTDRDGTGTTSRTIDVTNVAPTAAITSGNGLVAGELDPSFGTAGRVSTALATADDYPSAAAIQPDRKAVVALSYRQPDGTYDIAVARYLPSGALDQAFGTNGVTVTGLGNFRGLLIQSDGRIVLASGSTLIRLNSNGTRDAGFGTDGTGEVQ